MPNSFDALVIKRRIFLPSELIVILLGPCAILGVLSLKDSGDFDDIIIVYFVVAGLVNVFSVILLYRLVNELLTRKPRIIIDQGGIEHCEDDEILKWDIIKYAYVKKQRRRTKRSRTTYHLLIITNNNEKRINITDFNYSKSDVKEAVEGFSGRDIGDYSDRVRGELNAELVGILHGNSQSEEIMTMVAPFGRKLGRIKSLVFLTMLALSIFLQVLEVATFVLLLGFIASWYVSKYVGERLEQSFRLKEPIAQLDDETFQKVALAAGIKDEERSVSIAKFFFWVMTVIIFIISVFFF